MVGTIGPLAVAIWRQSMRAEDSLGGGPGSAMTTAAGLTATKAVGASAQVASTMGKAPAPLKAATSSVAGFSATTISGPCSDMPRTRVTNGPRHCTGRAVNTALTGVVVDAPGRPAPEARLRRTP